MKKILIFIFFLTLFMTPAQGQILGLLGANALKSLGNGALNAVTGAITQRLEAKAENAVTKGINNIFGEVKRDTLSSSAITGMEGLSMIFGNMADRFNAESEKGTAPLRDFSEQNAIRREHNLTLEYDDWD